MYFKPAFSNEPRMLYMSSPQLTRREARALFAFKAFALFSGISHLRSQRCGHNDHTINVGNHHVTRIDQSARTNDGDIDGAQSGLDASFGVNRFADDRETHFFKVCDVAHATINDEASSAARLKAGGQQVAEKAIVVVSRAGSYSHVAGLQLLSCHVHHPVVAGLQKNRHRCTANVRAFVDGTHIGLHQPDTAHGLVDGGDA